MSQSYGLLVQEVTTSKKIPDMIQVFEITCLCRKCTEEVKLHAI